MNIEMIENIITLLAVIIAMLSCLFRYIDIPRRGYLALCIYFIAHLLSDYYWTVYSLVMNNDPDVSEFIAYFGWNLSYAVMLLVVIYMSRKEEKRYFHPLMLVPIPINIYQFLLYIQFGGIFNNLWSGIMLTAAAVVCIRSIIYYLKKRGDGVHPPYLHLFILLHIITSYGMWTVSCYDWPKGAGNPYYWFELANSLFTLLLPWAAGKNYEAEGYQRGEKNAEEIGFQVRIQGLVLFIIAGVCAGGYYLAIWMKNTIPEGDDSGVYNIIAVTLLVISLFLALLILAVLYMVFLRYRTVKEEEPRTPEEGRSRFNLILTLIVTLGLMIFSVIYNSNLYYGVASSRMYETGEDKAETAAAELQNYLYLAQSTLKVTADTVELMIEGGEDQAKIEEYILKETEKQKTEFDENFTGIYAYVRGKYMDGLGWVPPEGYDSTQRSWYTDAVDAHGKVVIVAPYIDAQTGSAVITICKSLTEEGSEGSPDVVALDVIVNHIQELTEEISLGGKGYAMVIDDDGMIVAHHDRTLVGNNLKDQLGEELFANLTEPGNHSKEAVINDADSTVFTSSVMDQWYVLIVVGDEELFEETRAQLVVNVVVSILIFALISLFYFLGYRNEQVYSKKMEEMKVGRQRQEYEAKVLRLEKSAADEANRAKSSFLADMSHEIRTPINAILGMNEMIIRRTGEEEVLEYARNIKSSGATLLDLINSILDFSKIEDGKMEIVPVKYKLSSMITYLVNAVGDRAASKGLAFDVNVVPGLPSELYGDDMRIRQVIVNLLTNAVKYTPEGSVTMTIDEVERSDDRILLYVEVKDTGIGIKDEDMEKLFQSFERLDIVRNRNIEGTGLGISIVTKLLELMGSELMVSSTYGEGSVFSFELWQKIEDAEPIGDYRTAPGSGAGLKSYRGSFKAPQARILVVDDTRMNLTVVSGLLRETRITIDTAMNGPDAIKLSEEMRYDAILLDQRMPGMDGSEVLANIRSSEASQNHDTPVICLTADAVRGARERYIAQGFNDYITKPVDGHELERILAENIAADKVVIGSGKTEEGTAENKGMKDILPLLEMRGFDTVAGLSHCGDDTDIYMSVLSEFSKEYSKKSENLRKYYDRKEWKDYSILIHSVKSSAKTIGAMELSQLAAGLERASDAGDEVAVRADHARALRLYKEVSSVIKNNINVKDEDVSDDDDILEFAPNE
ncbi:MAG: response regulator [Lachnospiraceae bacterium]|nr:response regulator [Lachnospiraceae bacterium]